MPTINWMPGINMQPKVLESEIHMALWKYSKRARS